MSTETRQAIRQLLETQNTMTLATCEGDRPWATAVFYASDPELNLYFVSDERTRHGHPLQTKNWAAGAIHPDCREWMEVYGVQFEGPVNILEGMARTTALNCYFDKFPEIKTLCEQPRTQNEETIATRLLAAHLYQLKPQWMRLIDNRRHFGCKAEIVLDPPS